MGSSALKLSFPGKKMRARRQEDPQAFFCDFGQLTETLGNQLDSQSSRNYACLFLYLKNWGKMNEIIVQIFELFVGKNAI